MRILMRGMTNWSIIFYLRRGPTPAACHHSPSARGDICNTLVRGQALSIHLAQHDVDRSDERDDVRDEMTLDEAAQPLQIAERRRPHAEPVRVGRLAVADDEEAELPFRRLDGVIRFTGRRFDQARHL